MPKLVIGYGSWVTGILVLLITHYSLLITPVSARTTPEDILNQRKAEYESRIKNYSSPSKKRLETFTQKIADLNKKHTDELDRLMIRQGQILDEYIHRNNIDLPLETDGIHRRDNPVENARYWITYAHEAVAYQAAKTYLINPTSESNINTAIINSISALQSDMGVLKGKVIKSQVVLKELVDK